MPARLLPQLTVRLSLRAVRALERESERQERTRSEALELIVTRYLGKVDDGAKGVLLPPLVEPLKRCCYTVEPSFLERLSQVDRRYRLGNQAVIRAAIYDYLGEP